jgi:ADP-ribosylglycohydrolase
MLTRSSAARAWDSLTGLSVGDALGAQYFVPNAKPRDLDAGELPPPPWPWTDDTEMACSVVAALLASGGIDQDALARDFARRCQPQRGYGPGAVVLLHRIRAGAPWPAAAAAMFQGQGSCGNGAAMRVAPLGAYFADDPARAAREAALSAEVTHCHPEGVAGAVAVALAAAHTARRTADPLAAVAADLPASEVRTGVQRSRALRGVDVGTAARELGNGARLLAQDTVPFCLWAADRFTADYPAAIRACVCAGGDTDTTASIVGGIVAARTGSAGVPADWIAAREPLPAWLGRRSPA